MVVFRRAFLARLVIFSLLLPRPPWRNFEYPSEIRSPLCVNGVLDVDSCSAEDEPAADEYRQTLAEADGGHA